MFRIWRILFFNGSWSTGYVICSGWNPEILHSIPIACWLLGGKLFLLDSRMFGGPMKVFYFTYLCTRLLIKHSLVVPNFQHFIIKMCRSCILPTSVSKQFNIYQNRWCSWRWRKAENSGMYRFRVKFSHFYMTIV